MLTIFMVPVYGEYTTVHKPIQICRRNKAGRAGFAVSKMVSRTCNFPKRISSFVLQNLPWFFLTCSRIQFAFV